MDGRLEKLCIEMFEGIVESSIKMDRNDDKLVG